MIPVPGKGMVPYPRPPVPPGDDWTPPGLIDPPGPPDHPGPPTSPNPPTSPGSAARAAAAPMPADEATRPDPPGPLAMAGSLARALAAHVADGLRPASEDVRAGREATCRVCPHHDEANARCGRCGCHLPAKIAWNSSTCPEGRWSAY